MVRIRFALADLAAVVVPMGSLREEVEVEDIPVEALVVTLATVMEEVAALS